ncbi:MAG: sialate O-acetylesterase [candidate division KSB1 bacterium]|nr:sialate O-acetylesterase [candidate division KSB1 bacterium]
MPPEPRGPGHPHTPAGLYNAMIHPLAPFGMRGAIWYQGEANAGRARQYRTLLPAMINDWRRVWDQKTCYFGIVQLANYMAVSEGPEESAWAELREAQAMTAETLKNTGLAVIIDIGEADDIHPKNKQDVGKRLGLWARAQAYGQDVLGSGPVYTSMSIENGRAIIDFAHTADSLVSRGSNTLKGFSIAGPDREFVPAQAEIRGDQVVVWSDTMDEPRAVRYAWANNPVCNLYNSVGLPAGPFRTDDWPGVTDGVLK